MDHVIIISLLMFPLYQSGLTDLTDVLSRHVRWLIRLPFRVKMEVICTFLPVGILRAFAKMQPEKVIYCKRS